MTLISVVAYCLRDWVCVRDWACARSNFPAKNRFWWTHFENNSRLLFSKFDLSAFRMQSFSWRQRLHLFPPLEYEAARFRIDQLIVKSCCFSFKFHTYFESSVLFLYITLLNDLLWLYNRFLKVFPVMPMYSFGSELLVTAPLI
jgi:hypothetical protein